MSETKKSNQIGTGEPQLKAELVGGCLMVYREAPSETAPDGTVKKGEITDVYSEYLGAFRQNRKILLPYTLKEGEDNKIYLFQEMTPLQCRGVQLTAQLMELRRNKKAYEDQLESLRHIRRLEPELEEQLHGAKRQKKLEHQLRSMEEQEQSIIDLHNREATGEQELEEEVPTICPAVRGEEPMYAAVFSMGGELFEVYGPISSVYNNMLKSNIIVKNVGMNGSRLWVDVWVRFENLYKLELGECRLCVGELFSQPQTPVILNRMIEDDVDKKKYLLRFSIPTRDIADCTLRDDSPVKMESNLILLTIVVNGVIVPYRLRKKVPAQKRFGMKHSSREVWLPLGSAYVGDCSVHVRRTTAGSYIVFKRDMEPIEKNAWYRFMESTVISFLLFNLGRVFSHLPRRKKIALFFEKFSEKAEEGTFELCQMCQSSKRTKSYFVIDEHTEDYQRIKDAPFVVRKYSLKYYWLVYNVNYFIAAEAPIHLTIFNSHNRYLRWSLLRHPFVFLQHGITSIKRQGPTSTFLKGRAGQCSYILVSSQREKALVADTFIMSPSRVWITGILMFDRCQYKHMNQDSPDKITLMLTWKPYEKVMTHFEQSTYYQYTIQAYNILQKYVPRENINIVAHPHSYEKLKQTPIGDLVWDRPISEVLRQSKLLITDYSSVCWNSFYQGGGVVFYQPDLKEYESVVGELLIKDDQYTGHRVFDTEHLEQVLSAGIKEGGVVDLSYFRTQEFEEKYQAINAFHDGKNSQRVYQKLKEKGFV